MRVQNCPSPSSENMFKHGSDKYTFLFLNNLLTFKLYIIIITLPLYLNTFFSISNILSAYFDIALLTYLDTYILYPST